MGQFQFFSFLSFTRDPVFVANLSNFLSWLVITWFFYWFVTELSIGSPTARLVAACWVAMKPSCLVSYELCHAPYNFGIMIYFIGVWSLINYEHKIRNWILLGIYFVALFGLWHTSFTLLRSIMFLHYGTIVILFFSKKITYRTLAILALMPLVSWAMRGVPMGYYANYNQVSMSHLNFRSFGVSFLETNWWIFRRLRRWIGRDPVLIVSAITLLPLFFYGLFASRNTSREEVSKKIASMPIWLWLVCSLAFILFLILPYVATGRTLDHNDTESRHAILFFFPQALFILGMYQLCSLSRWKKTTQWVFCVGIVLFFVGTVENQRRWQIDGFVQDSIVENLKTLNFNKEASVLIFNQRALDLFSIDRRPNIYEYNGLLDAALGEQKWIGIDATVVKSLDDLPQDMLEMYACKNCKVTNLRQEIDILPTVTNPFQWHTYFTLLWSEYFNEEEYRLKVKSLLRFEIR